MNEDDLDEEEIVARATAAAAPHLARGDTDAAWTATLAETGVDASTQARIAALVRPALRLDFEGASETSTSWVGGEPKLPAGFSSAKDVRPIAQIDLAAFADDAAALGLPAVTLAFLYDAKAQPWGYDPKDRGQFAVVQVDAPARTAAEAHGRPVALRRERTWPHAAAPRVEALGLSEDELTRYHLAANAMRDADPVAARAGRVGGHADPVQGPMEMKCELVRRGVYCGRGWPKDEVARAAPDALRWRLVLQLESTLDGPLPMWGDMGCLYFWMREDDLAARRWSEAWCVLQCH